MTGSNLKRYKSKKNITNYMPGCKRFKRKKRKGFYGRSKTFQAKTTLRVPTLLQLYPL